MLTTRRASYDFVVQITEACKESKGKTQLYYHIATNLSGLERWLNLAIRLKLIEVEENTNMYRTTQKGIKFLIAWENVQTFLKKEA